MQNTAMPLTKCAHGVHIPSDLQHPTERRQSPYCTACQCEGCPPPSQMPSSARALELLPVAAAVARGFYRWLKDTHTLEDVEAEANLALFQAVKKMGAATSEQYARAACNNHLKDLLDHTTAKKRTAKLVLLTDPVNPSDPESPTWSESIPDDKAVDPLKAAVLNQQVERAEKILTLPQRNVLEFHVNGLSQRAIAKQLGMHKNKPGELLRQAKERLHDLAA